jgi:integration host factor subunit alpha
MSITKMDITAAICEKLDIPKNGCIGIVESIFEIIKNDLDRGNDVKISGFGKWTVKTKKKRNGRNPQTGESMMIDARKVVTFKPSAVLRDKLND